MDIITKQLIELRTKRGNTQEELAEYLNVSPQAVSKWERGEGTPKVPLLPDIARYYHVTVDELLGGGEVRKSYKIEQFCANAKKHYDSGHIEKAVEIWRDACSEYPRDMFCVSQLMYALHDLNTSAENSGVDVNEIIKLGETILDESSKDSIREKTITVLCINLCKCGRYEEAKEYAHFAHGMSNSYEHIMVNILFSEGNHAEGKELCEDNILEYLRLILTEVEYLNLLEVNDGDKYAKFNEIYHELLNARHSAS